MATASDRFLRIQTWRENAASPELSQDTSTSTQLCLDCMTFYRLCLRQLSQENCIPKPFLTQLTRNYEALALWAHGYDIAHGGLDEVLLSSRRARRCYLESLTNLCATLISRLVLLFPSLKLDGETRTLERTLEAGILCLEDTHLDCDSVESTSSKLSKIDNDSIEEIIKDLEVDVDGLIALDPLISCPADRTQEEPRERAPPTWAPHQAICERIANRFPETNETIVQRLGKATWDSFLRCKALRENGGEETAPVDTGPVLPAQTVAASSRSKDSGLGSSLPTISYAETIMSYKLREGESVKVPPLPKAALDGKPFECLVCGAHVIARTNSEWKTHLFRDLRPYICVFEACSQTANSFMNRKEWSNHTLTTHVTNLPPTFEKDNPGVSCPLCLQGLSVATSTKHIAAHLEEVSLGVLKFHADIESECESLPSPPSAENAEVSYKNGPKFTDSKTPDLLPEGQDEDDQLTKLEENTGHHTEAELSPIPADHQPQDYQLQLMLLEQQNKKRLMRARGELDEILRHSRAAEQEANPLRKTTGRGERLAEVMKATTQTGKVRRACQTCRHKKIRCDTNDVCQPCAAKGVSCVRVPLDTLTEFVSAKASSSSFPTAERDSTETGRVHASRKRPTLVPFHSPSQVRNPFGVGSSDPANLRPPPKPSPIAVPMPTTRKKERDGKAKLWWTCCSCSQDDMELTFFIMCVNCGHEKCNDCKIWMEDSFET